MLFAAAQVGGIILAVCSPSFWHKADDIIVVHAIFIVGEVIGELLGSVIIYFSKFFCIGSIIVSYLAAENIPLSVCVNCIFVVYLSVPSNFYFLGVGIDCCYI